MSSLFSLLLTASLAAPCAFAAPRDGRSLLDSQLPLTADRRMDSAIRRLVLRPNSSGAGPR